MRRITFTNSRGESISMADDVLSRPYVLHSIDGTGGAPVTAQTQRAPYQDGQTLVDTLLEPRPIPIVLGIRSDNEHEIYQRRRELLRVFNPKNGEGILRFQHPGGSYDIPAVAEMPPTFPDGWGNRVPGLQVASIELLCPDPLWRDTVATVGSMILWAGGLEFGTLEFPVEFGTSGSQYTAANTGDVPTPVQITIAGPCVNPIIDNLTTGKTLAIVQSVLSGESIEIDTAFGQKRVEHIDGSGTRTNVMHWLTDASELWDLAVGDNALEYSETSGAGGAGAVTVSWYNKYTGV
jgi:hypothetical protein